MLTAQHTAGNGGRGGRRRLPLKIAVICLLTLVWWWTFGTDSLTHQLDAVCRIESVTRLDVISPIGDTLHIAPATGQLTDDVGNATSGDSAVTSGCYISADGHLVTAIAAIGHAGGLPDADSLRVMLRREADRLERLAATKHEAMRELDYYARTHTVTDDGYNSVMAFRTTVARQTATVDSLRARLDRIMADTRPLRSVRHCRATALQAIPTRRQGVATMIRERHSLQLLGADGQLALFRTTDGHLPPAATYIPLWPVAHTGASYMLGCFGTSDMADIVPVRLRLDCGEGSVVTDRRGRLCGLRTGGKTVRVAAVRRFCLRTLGSAAWLGHALAGQLRRALLPPPAVQVSSDTAVTVYAPRNVAGLRRTAGRYAVLHLAVGRYTGRVGEAQPEGYGVMAYKDGSRYAGQWLGGKRAGYGTLKDTLRQVITGIWCADTLAYGTATTAAGTYTGTFDCDLRRSGRGTKVAADGTVYIGEWKEGRREGFGFAVGERKMVRAGVWHNDRFRGEQMIYTADRVYGIDISRYQHDIGRRHYAIDWSRVRIRRLGAANATRIRGVQDYAVSFVYVKASEGVRLRNRYYAADAAACRRRGIHVGAYHFFSTRTPGRAQALHFMRTARPRLGDLPPVLDVEPTDRQIADMGGARAMYREMAAWVRYVKAACGTTPVLYVSQTFVNKYMENIPADLAQCQVWIARYGEYKPYVHLLYWQLSPHGRVAGIHGEVDINVFNGDRTQFAAYVATHRVSR